MHFWRREWDSNTPVLLGKLEVFHVLPTFVPTTLESGRVEDRRLDCFTLMHRRKGLFEVRCWPLGRYHVVVPIPAEGLLQIQAFTSEANQATRRLPSRRCIGKLPAAI
jgi:hypothetical protein